MGTSLIFHEFISFEYNSGYKNKSIKYTEEICIYSKPRLLTTGQIPVMRLICDIRVIDQCIFFCSFFQRCLLSKSPDPVNSRYKKSVVLCDTFCQCSFPISKSQLLEISSANKAILSDQVHGKTAK